MSVINDNLLGNFNLSQYMKECSNKKNTDFQTKLNLKKKQFYLIFINKFIILQFIKARL